MSIIERIQERVKGGAEGRTKLYFVTRILKEGIGKRAKVLDKYDYKTYRVDITDDIRKEIHTTATECINKLVNKDTVFAEFDVIHDGQHTLMTYPMTTKAMSFKNVLENQLPNHPPPMDDLAEVVKREELWASVIGMYTVDDEWVYAFRKILKGKVTIDPENNKERTKVARVIHTLFNTTNQRLEVIHGETIFLDKSIDCFYFDETFYVHKQTQFEQIVGIEDEYKEEAHQVVLDLEGSGLFHGIDVMKGMLQNVAIHRKLVRLKKMGLYHRLDAQALKKMKKVAKERGFVLKLADGRFVLEDEGDVDIAIKMLCAYFKKDPIFGDTYGTFAGRRLNPVTVE